MSKESRKGKGSAPERNLPDLIPLGRAPTRPIKSSSKLEPQLPKSLSTVSGVPSVYASTLDSSSHSSPNSPQDNAPTPPQKRARIGSVTAGSNSAPSTPPRLKAEESTLKSALRKVPTQQQASPYNNQPQHQQQSPPKSLWSLNRNVKLEQETGLINLRQVDEEVYSTFSQSTWESPPPLQHIRAALQYLKFNALKPDPVITSGLLRLGQAMPELLRDQTISAFMVQMLRPEFTHSFKIRTNGAVVFLICALLHIAWDSVDHWPTDFVMAYLEDALGERSWCAHADTKAFVSNVLTAFRTDDLVDEEEADEIKFDPVRLDEKSNTLAVMVTIDFIRYTESLSLKRRYQDQTTRSNIKYIALQTMWEHIPSAVGASAVEASVRSLIKVMMVTCRWAEVRLKAMGCMEFWLGSFMKNAKPLLRLILRQISSQETLSRDDMETWTMLLDFRYKGRTHQVEAVKEELRVALLNLSGQELVGTGLHHIMEVELNPNELKNPYHLDLMELLLEAIANKPAVEFGQLIQERIVDAALQMEGSTVSPPMAPVVLVVKRWIRHLGKRGISWTADVIIGLLKDGPHLTQLAQKQEQHQQLRIPPGGRNAPTLWLLMLMEIVCNVLMATAIDAKEGKDIKASKFAIEQAHTFTLKWFQAISSVGSPATAPNEGDICRTPFGSVPLDALRICVARLLFLDPPQSYAMDTTSQEFDTTLIYKVIENGLPLTETGLVALLGIRLPNKMLLSVVGEYVSRATDLSRFYPESCIVKNPDVIVKIFDLSRFCETDSSQVLKLASNETVVNVLKLILALVVWDSMPVVRMLLELCVSQHYSFPPPNYTSRSEPSSERLLRLGIEADQKDRDCVLAWEKETLVLQGLWSDNRGDEPLQPNESQYLGWLMRLDFGPTQPARAPPVEIMQQLRGMNDRFGLGMKLASSRDPDYLGRMVGSNDDAAWVDQLLRDVPEILSALPAATLCARYCRSIVLAHHRDSTDASSSTGPEAGSVDSSVKKKLVGYLESVMAASTAFGIVYSSHTQAQDPSARFQEVRDIFEYFLVRLSPTQSPSSSITVDAETVVEETKMAMNALFHGTLQWPNVLMQTVHRTAGSGFFGKSLKWIESFVATENDVQWIIAPLEFLLKVELTGEDEAGLEQSLLTISRLLMSRLFIFDWLVREQDAIVKALARRIDEYFAKNDDVMEDVSMKEPEYSATHSTARAKVRIELSDGTFISTYPEIVRLTLLILSTGDATKHQAGSTRTKLFMDPNGQEPQSQSPKKLADGSGLLTCVPLMMNDIEQRLRLVQLGRDTEVVRAAMDGLGLVEVIEIAKEAFGVDLKTAQIIHEALLIALDREKDHHIPIHLDQGALSRLSLLLKYYADNGGQVSQRALDAVNARFNSSSSTIPAALAMMTTKATCVVLPDFFHMSS
ncbi:Integrator complex subunit 1 [Mortierella claussenii]|nr:Integrator complex subunit 1 [Mortierella claussenii]